LEEAHLESNLNFSNWKGEVEKWGSKSLGGGGSAGASSGTEPEEQQSYKRGKGGE
jgi:hypothetical protein